MLKQRHIGRRTALPSPQNTAAVNRRSVLAGGAAGTGAAGFDCDRSAGNR